VYQEVGVSVGKYVEVSGEHRPYSWLRMLSQDCHERGSIRVWVSLEHILNDQMRTLPGCPRGKCKLNHRLGEILWVVTTELWVLGTYAIPRILL
jgi:hypothetical protein